ncbi:hypothetical protein M408DRAFT_308054 [Serendipita vermifera MAFF 305830]|uniref:Uncharacterized protein n=1 Tax=Serendipita vermifera MAFF 305830 TaxID=933852 RepID=A0A0C2XHT5_SERVB|nr:hypothetical protein M408DRAFT_308054 [Serendipita vermifera MAFF 305830]
MQSNTEYSKNMVDSRIRGGLVTQYSESRAHKQDMRSVRSVNIGTLAWKTRFLRPLITGSTLALVAWFLPVAMAHTSSRKSAVRSSYQQSHKNPLVDAIGRFSEMSKQATLQLSRLGSNVEGAIDSIMAMDNCATKVLENIEREQPLVQVMASATICFAAPGVFRKTLMGAFYQVAETIGMKPNHHLYVVHSLIMGDYQQAIFGMKGEMLSRLVTWLGGKEDRVVKRKAYS